MNRYRKHNTYGQLNAVILGSYYTPDYFSFIRDPLVREPLMQIAQEINEDLDYFEQILSSHGSTVLRPELISVHDFIEFFHTHKFFAPPPLQPRNNHSVIGDSIYQLSRDRNTINNCLFRYNDNIISLVDSNTEIFTMSLAQNQYAYNSSVDTWYRKEKYQELAGGDWPTFENYVNGDRSTIPFIQEELKYFENSLCYETKELGPLEGPNIFPTDEALVVDSNEYTDYRSWAIENINYNKSIQVINTSAGHTDGCFTVLGNKTIIGISPLIDYSTCFPGYHVIPVTHSDYMEHVERSWAEGTGGRWWVSGQDPTQPLIDHITKYMKSWTGHSYETAFDVNTLSINPETVCVINSRVDLTSQLKGRNIDCITVPWRHRFFVDCGLHCITLDLNRS
jgi:hypothetical protein